MTNNAARQELEEYIKYLFVFDELEEGGGKDNGGENENENGGGASRRQW